MLCLCAAQLKFWFQTDLGRENSASCYRQGRQLLLTFLTMFTRWSRSTSNFYALIGQNLTGEFMWKIYTATWNLFTLTAEADRVLNVGKTGECIETLWNFYIYWGHIRSLTWDTNLFNCLFPQDVQNEIQLLSRVFCYSWLVCLMNFWLRNAPLVKVGNPFSDGIVFVFHLAGCVKRVEKSQAILALLDIFQELHLEW